MSETAAIVSPAFRKAALAGERLRIITLTSAILAMAAVSIIRGGLPGQVGQMQLLPLGLACVNAFVAYEFAMLRVVCGMIRTGREPAAWRWIRSVVVQTAFPTALVVLMTFGLPIGPYRALVAPAVFTYAFFLILATLRLSPLLRTLTGAFAAAQYLAVVAFTSRCYPRPPEMSGASALPFCDPNVTQGVTRTCRSLTQPSCHDRTCPYRSSIFAVAPPGVDPPETLASRENELNSLHRQ